MEKEILIERTEEKPGEGDLILDGFVFATRQRVSIASVAVRSARSGYERKRECSHWDFQRLERLTVLIEKHYKSDQPVSFYCAELKVKAKTLNRLTSFVLGQTVYQLVLDRRLKESRILLENRHKLIKEISYELGFKSPFRFGRFFKAMTGMTAREYRIWSARKQIQQIIGNMPMEI